jgi:hypothetical protein
MYSPPLALLCTYLLSVKENQELYNCGLEVLRLCVTIAERTYIPQHAK